MNDSEKETLNLVFEKDRLLNDYKYRFKIERETANSLKAELAKISTINETVSQSKHLIAIEGLQKDLQEKVDENQ
jgi:hypothetical protein